jgi:DNA-binding beta-propeller fold protein YncE
MFNPWKALVPAVAVLGLLAGPPAAMAHGGTLRVPVDEVGWVYTQTNDPGGNVVQWFDCAADGSLKPGGSIATGGAGLATLGGRQGAACWVAVSPDGRLAYTGNASGSISGFAIAGNGSLTALNADGLTAVLVPSPRDLDFSRDGRYVYAVSPGNATAPAQVTGYRVAPGGALTPITSAPALPGITGAAAG